MVLTQVLLPIYKKQDYEVIGLFMKNWHDESVTLLMNVLVGGYNDAMLKLKNWIFYQTVDLSKEYKERIVDYMFDEYASGTEQIFYVNREIKFDVLKLALSFVQIIYMDIIAKKTLLIRMVN